MSLGFPYNRLFLSALIHATDMHLYGNMTSLLWKGCNLERIYGGKRFLFLVVYSWFMSHILLVLLSYFLYKYIYVYDEYSSGYNTCAGKIFLPHQSINITLVSNTKIVVHLWIYNLLPIFIIIVGFSAVLFSLKFILNQQEDTISSFYSLPIASKYLCWFELIVIQMIYPNASFIGHFCGIVAGALCYYVFFPFINKFQRLYANQASHGRTTGSIGRRI